MEKNNKKTLIIIVAVIALILLGTVIISKTFVKEYEELPVTGEYNVKETSAILTDKNRIEEFEKDGSMREVPIHIFYPESKDGTEINDKFPLVFFSHGAFGVYNSNRSTYRELASNGYVVVSMDHPYHSFTTTDTQGKKITVDPTFMKNALTLGNSETTSEEEIYSTTSAWMKLRIDDMNFVIDMMTDAVASESIEADVWFTDTPDEIIKVLYLTDSDKIGVMGHSLGGATAVTVGRDRDDIDAVIDFDGTMLGEIDGVKEPYPIPLLEFDNEDSYHEELRTRENNEKYVNNVILDNAKEGFRTCILGTKHMNYTDLPLIAPGAAKMLGLGPVDTEKCILKMNEITLDFFNCYLKGEGTFSVEETYELQENPDNGK